MSGCRTVLFWFLMVGMFCLGRAGRAQVKDGMGSDSEATPTTLDGLLHTMSDRAAVVFVGTVSAVRRGAAGVPTGVVEIDFAVEEAVRGCSSGGTYTLREWAGLWAGDEGRYRTGERLFLMLHAPSASGLSSPVGGAEGVIRVRGGGQAVREEDTTTAEQGPVMDLRWVGAKLGRAVQYRKEMPRQPKAGVRAMVAAPTAHVAAAVTEGTGIPVGAEMAALRAVEATASAEHSVPAQEASVATIVTLMSQWKRAADATR